LKPVILTAFRTFKKIIFLGDEMNKFSEKGKRGRLEVVAGSMFSGKTEELMRRLKRAEYAKQRVLTIKHHIDKRYSQVPTCIVSHEGRERFAFVIADGASGFEKILELSRSDVDVIGLDEVQFFSTPIISVIEQLVESGKRVIAAGLDLDFRGEPFSVMPTLLALADEVTKLKAICVICGSDAHHTQRIINGLPAKYDDPLILVGAAECYEARCRNCFVMEKPKCGVVAGSAQAMATSGECV
jgi:thymidine kinase